jgi:hypothetical protein
MMNASTAGMQPKDFHEDSQMINKIALAIGYSGSDTLLFNYIHKRAGDSGQGINYFRNGPRDDQAYDIWDIGMDLGMGKDNNLNLVVGRVNSADKRIRDYVEAEEITRLYMEARERGVTLADLYLSKLMLFFETGSASRNVLCAYESDILPTLKHIKSQNAMAEKKESANI